MHACRIGNNDRILPLLKRWMDLILDGKKTLEIKGCRCPSLVGTRIWLRMSKSCLVFGSARVVSWEGPLTKTQWELLRSSHCVEGGPLYQRSFAWKLADVVRLPRPIAIINKKGCRGIQVGPGS